MQGFEISSVQMRPPTFKVDKSTTLSFNTGEMVKEEQLKILENSGSLGTLLFIPEGQTQLPPKLEVKDFEHKKPSERLYNVLYVYWKETHQDGDFYDFYRQWIERDIEKIKQLIPNQRPF